MEMLLLLLLLYLHFHVGVTVHVVLLAGSAAFSVLPSVVDALLGSLDAFPMVCSGSVVVVSASNILTMVTGIGAYFLLSTGFTSADIYLFLLFFSLHIKQKTKLQTPYK